MYIITDAIINQYMCVYYHWQNNCTIICYIQLVFYLPMIFSLRHPTIETNNLQNICLAQSSNLILNKILKRKTLSFTYLSVTIVFDVVNRRRMLRGSSWRLLRNLGAKPAPRPPPNSWKLSECLKLKPDMLSKESVVLT